MATIVDVEHFRMSMTVGEEVSVRVGFDEGSYGALNGDTNLGTIEQLTVDSFGLVELNLVGGLTGAADGLELLVEGYTEPIWIEWVYDNDAYNSVDDSGFTMNHLDFYNYLNSVVGQTLKLQINLKAKKQSQSFGMGRIVGGCVNVDGISPLNGNV